MLAIFFLLNTAFSYFFTGLYGVCEIQFTKVGVNSGNLDVKPMYLSNFVTKATIKVNKKRKSGGSIDQKPPL